MRNRPKAVINARDAHGQLNALPPSSRLRAPFYDQMSFYDRFA